ncbi:MAG: L,D-transpeptidase [Mycobacteriaceae bacterium]|nr:L,D-transpeptidase [Mycobacteriaceae bacterium]
MAAMSSNEVPPVASIEPAAGAVVGVGHPVVVTFTGPVIDRAAAERGISINAARPMTGRFEWTNDNVVQWVPNGFWPAHSSVKVTALGWKSDFDAGSAVVGVASISSHTFTVSIDGQVVRTMPASMGKPKHPTPVGDFTALSKERSVIMDSRTIGIPLSDPEGYRLTVNWAVRVTSGGVYVHSAPWSVDQQGVSNVSHGCINLSPSNAEWYFNTVHVGDPIIVQA